MTKEHATPEEIAVYAAELRLRANAAVSSDNKRRQEILPIAEEKIVSVINPWLQQAAENGILQGLARLPQVSEELLGVVITDPIQYPDILTASHFVDPHPNSHLPHDPEFDVFVYRAKNILEDLKGHLTPSGEDMGEDYARETTGEKPRTAWFGFGYNSPGIIPVTMQEYDVQVNEPNIHIIRKGRGGIYIGKTPRRHGILYTNYTPRQSLTILQDKFFHPDIFIGFADQIQSGIVDERVKAYLG